jgi:ComF family protein
MKKLLCAFKFHRRLALLRTLLGLLERCLLEREPAFPWDAVAAVPMRGALRRERGFNQAELLAAGVARLARKPFLKDALSVRGPARQQARLGRKEREENVRDLFGASPAAAGKKVLLVDDILTTGQTASECARALKRAGAARVDVLVVAR